MAKGPSLLLILNTLLLLLSAFVLVFGLSNTVYAESNNWTAQGNNTLWETSSNWSNGTTPIQDQDVKLTEEFISQNQLDQLMEWQMNNGGAWVQGPIKLIEVSYDDPGIDQTVTYNSIEIDAPYTQGIYLNHSSGAINSQNMKIGSTTSGSYLISGTAELNIVDTFNVGVHNQDHFMGYEGLVEQIGGTVNANTIVLAGAYGSWGNGQGKYQLDAGEVNAQLVIGLEGNGVFTQTGGVVNGGLILGASSTTSTGDEHFRASGYGTYNLEGGILNSDQEWLASQSVINQTGGLNSVALNMNLGSMGSRCSGLPWQHCMVDPTVQVRSEYIMTNGNLEVGFGGSVLNTPALVLGSGDIDPYVNNKSGGYAIFNQSGGNAAFKGDVVIGDLDNTLPPGPHIPDYDPSDNPNGYGEGHYKMSGGSMRIKEGDLYVGENFLRDDGQGYGVYYSKGIMEQTGGTVDVDGSVYIAAAPGRISSNLSGPNEYAISGLGSKLTVGGDIHVGNENVVIDKKWDKIAVFDVSDGAIVDLDGGHIWAHNGGKVSGIFSLSGNLNMAGGVLSPGNSPGTITIDGDLNATNNSLFEIEVFSFNDGDYDVIDILGNATFESATFLFDFTEFDLGGHEIDDFIGETFDFIKVAGEVVLGDIVYEIIGKEWILDIDLASGGARIAGIEGGTNSPVPEPTTMLLFGIGLLGFAGVSRKKNTKA